MFNEKQLQVLNNELDSNRIKSRQKGNINLSYLEGFDVIETANRIFGYGNWDYSISKLESVSSEFNQNQNNVICYKAVVQILIHNENHTKDISREDVGFGTGIAKTLSDAHEGGAKEAVTDAIKRTLRSFGNQFGNSLYNKSKSSNNTASQAHNQNSYQQAPHNNTPQNNHNSQQYQSHNQSSQANQAQQPYQHQQDFSYILNAGLSVVEQGENLIVVGDGIFDKKDIIKNSGFRWDTVNKVWYMQMRNVA